MSLELANVPPRIQSGLGTLGKSFEVITTH